MYAHAAHIVKCVCSDQSRQSWQCRVLSTAYCAESKVFILSCAVKSIGTEPRTTFTFWLSHRNFGTSFTFLFRPLEKMSSKSAFNSCSYAQDIDRTESSKVFEIEQCMYNLSEDFFRQTTLQEAVAPVESATTGVVSPEVFDESLNNAAASAAQSVHHIADILQRPISDELMKKLCFSELLLVCDGSETIVGGAAINVSLIAEEVLAAFSSTRLTILGHSTAESELMSFADRNCRPLQERKCETLISGTIRQVGGWEAVGEDASSRCSVTISTSHITGGNYVKLTYYVLYLLYFAGETNTTLL